MWRGLGYQRRVELLLCLRRRGVGKLWKILIELLGLILFGSSPKVWGWNVNWVFCTAAVLELNSWRNACSVRVNQTLEFFSEGCRGAFLRLKNNVRDRSRKGYPARLTGEAQRLCGFPRIQKFGLASACSVRVNQTLEFFSEGCRGAFQRLKNNVGDRSRKGYPARLTGEAQWLCGFPRI
ncbi:hypothetical protein Drorol1_Dr00028267 [Drosera rotundifolia]